MSPSIVSVLQHIASFETQIISKEAPSTSGLSDVTSGSKQATGSHPTHTGHTVSTFYPSPSSNHRTGTAPGRECRRTANSDQSIFLAIIIASDLEEGEWIFNHCLLLTDSFNLK